MFREPAPKAQADILRQVFAEYGIKIPHRKVLDVVARLRGRANWHVLSAQPEKGSPSPAAFQCTTRKSFCFEAKVPAATEDQLASLSASEELCAARWEQVHSLASSLGFDALVNIDVCEDEDEGNASGSVTLSVWLTGYSNQVKDSPVHDSLESLLNDLTAPCRLLPDEGISFQPWQLADVRELVKKM